MLITRSLYLLGIVGSVLLSVLATATPAVAADDKQVAAGINRDFGGWRATNVTYTLSAANPAAVDRVNFDLMGKAGAAPPRSVKVQLTAGGDWFGCTRVFGTRWSCATQGFALAKVRYLRVTAG